VFEVKAGNFTPTKPDLLRSFPAREVFLQLHCWNCAFSK